MPARPGCCTEDLICVITSRRAGEVTIDLDMLHPPPDAGLLDVGVQDSVPGCRGDRMAGPHDLDGPVTAAQSLAAAGC